MIETVLEILGGMIVLTGGTAIVAAASGEGDKTMSTRPKAPPPRPPEDLFDPFLAALESQVRENARLYAAVPTASWLAPDEIDARFAPAPVAERPIPEKYQAPIVLPPPPAWSLVNSPKCPSCGHKIHGTVEITAEHHGRPTMWQCTICQMEYTKAGETKGSKKRRKAAEAEAKRMADLVLPCGCTGDVTTRSYPSGGWDMGRYAVCKTCEGAWDYAPKMDDTGDPRKMHPRSGPVQWPNGNKLNDLPLPPSMGYSNTVVYRPEASIRMRMDPDKLPCGCPGSGPIGKHTIVGCRFTTCDRCEARWYPPSNDPSGRRLAQGEAVHYANGTIGD